MVVKLADGMSGTVTVIKTDEERQKFLEQLGKRLEEYRRPEHAGFTHNVMRIMIQDFKDIKDNVCVTFFVPPAGTMQIFGASHQMIKEGSQWNGACINYTQQDELIRRTQRQVQQVGEKLREQGFVGFAGLDLLLPEDGEDGWIIDINPRLNGSICLTSTKSHFMGLGYDDAIALVEGFMHG